jgi:hypothetical protein
MSRRASAIRTALFVALGVFISLFAVGQKARSLQIAEPIHLAANSTFTPGQPLSCSVQLTSGPSQVTIYSQPLGAVSFNGSVSSSTATVSAATSSTATGTITLYVKTDGAQTCSTMTTATLGSVAPMPQ